MDVGATVSGVGWDIYADFPIVSGSDTPIVTGLQGNYGTDQRPVQLTGPERPGLRTLREADLTAVAVDLKKLAPQIMLVDCGSDESAHLLEESLREPAEEDDHSVVTGQGKERERKQKAFIIR